MNVLEVLLIALIVLDLGGCVVLILGYLVAAWRMMRKEKRDE